MSEQSPGPLVPAAPGARVSHGGTAPGAQGHRKFPALRGAQSRTRTDNKSLPSPSHGLRGGLSSSPEPKPRQEERSGVLPNTLALRESPSPAFPTRTEGPFCSLLARERGRVSDPHNPGQGGHPCRRGAGRCWACAGRGWGRSRRGAQRSWGAQLRRGADRAGDCSPRTRQRSGGKNVRQNKTQVPQRPRRARMEVVSARDPQPDPGGSEGGAQGRPSVPFRCIDGQKAGPRDGLARRASHLVIHYRDLSGPRAARSALPAFVIPTCVLSLWGHSRVVYFLGCKQAVFISNDAEKGKKKPKEKEKEKKHQHGRG